MTRTNTPLDEWRKAIETMTDSTQSRPRWSELSDSEFLRRLAEDYNYITPPRDLYDRIVRIAGSLPSAVSANAETVKMDWPRKALQSTCVDRDAIIEECARVAWDASMNGAPVAYAVRNLKSGPHPQRSDAPPSAALQMVEPDDDLRRAAAKVAAESGTQQSAEQRREPVPCQFGQFEARPYGGEGDSIAVCTICNQPAGAHRDIEAVRSHVAPTREQLQDIAAAAFPESVELGTRCLAAIRQALRCAQSATAAISEHNLKLLAAGWVMEIAGAHSFDTELRQAAKDWASLPHPEDDQDVPTLLRSILIPEGRRSPPAGALGGGSPLRQHCDANPSRAGDGGEVGTADRCGGPK